MRYAAIDIGTNTFHLIIAEPATHGFHILHKDQEPVRLGADTINEGYISEPAFERAVMALTRFRRAIDRYEVHTTRAVATSAVRSARNGDKVVKLAKEKAAIQIETIDGDQEATLIHMAVQASGSLQNTSLIMDIGGGSTEFILANTGEILWKKSYDLGASRLWQKFFKTDPINAEDLQQITSHIESGLADLFAACRKHNPKVLIGTAGAFETFLSMSNPLAATDANMHPLDSTALDALFQRLCASSHAERTTMEGLIPLRVDMIVAAAILVQIVLRETVISEVQMTSFDLKMGLLQTMIIP